jgi:hypothetical protein
MDAVVECPFDVTQHADEYVPVLGVGIRLDVAEDATNISDIRMSTTTPPYKGAENGM